MVKLLSVQMAMEQGADPAKRVRLANKGRATGPLKCQFCHKQRAHRIPRFPMPHTPCSMVPVMDNKFTQKWQPESW
ncbi:MAG: hypothetical protein ACRER7_00795, partial [Gammaproteobacteria bacterium]